MMNTQSDAPCRKLLTLQLNHLTRLTKSDAPWRKLLALQLNHLTSLTKLRSVRLRTKWLWVRIRLQSLNGSSLYIQMKSAASPDQYDDAK